MPQVKQASKTLPLKYKVIILVIIFVLAAGAGTAFVLYQRDQDHKAVQNALDKRQSLVLRGHYDQALVLLKAAEPRAHTKAERLSILYYEAATSLSKNDMKAAYVTFKQYEALGGPTFESSRQIASTTAALGNKTEAVDYYRKAIELVKKTSQPNLQDEVSELEERIKVLQQ